MTPHPSAPRLARTLAILLSLVTVAACDRDARVAASDSAKGGHVVGLTVAPGVHVAAAPLDYTPPPDSAIPTDELGASIRRGLALVTHTTDSLPRYAPGNINCASCHIDAGRRRDAAGLLGVTARFPKYLDRTGAVIPIEDRINYCFTRSLAGSRIPSDSREMRDIVAYLAYLSTGVPQGAHVKGESMPKMPALVGDSARGGALFATSCAACHGPQGEGNAPLIPALWGARSYSIGASMARQERAATFIRHFMPQSNPGSLTDQQAYDLAAFIDAHPRPDSPGKEGDWPLGGAPNDVPYATQGHPATRPPARLIPRAHPEEAIVPAPRSVLPGSSAPARTRAAGTR